MFRKAPSSYLSIFCSSILGSTFKWCWLFQTAQLYSWTGLFPLCKIWPLLFSRTWIHLIFPKMRTHTLIPPLSLLLLHFISKCSTWLTFCTIFWSEFQWLGYKADFLCLSKNAQSIQELKLWHTIKLLGPEKPLTWDNPCGSTCSPCEILCAYISEKGVWAGWCYCFWPEGHKKRPEAASRAQLMLDNWMSRWNLVRSQKVRHTLPVLLLCEHIKPGYILHVLHHTRQYFKDLPSKILTTLLDKCPRWRRR